MKDFKVLKLLDKFKPLFEKTGVDYPIMRKILQVKFTLDGRRTPTVMMNNSNKKKKNEENSFIKSLWIYIIFGIILVPFVFMEGNYLFQMSFLFGILMFMMMTTLISDFSSVLLDLRDKDIILSKPVSGKTLSMAKTIHIIIYMLSITFFFAGPALIVSLFQRGFSFFIIFLFEIILMDLLIVALTALLYLLILKFFDGEKLKDIINYVQILLTITLSIGYQLIGRLFDFSDIMGIQFNPKWWQYLIPPMWFGAPFELILNHNNEFYILSFSILALAVPILAIIMYTKLTPSFESNLQKLNNISGEVKAKDKGLKHLISQWICRTKEERTFFRFATNMMKNEREFKLRVYPSLGFSLIFPFIFLLMDSSSGGVGDVSTSRRYFSIYFVALMIPTILMTIGYSSKYKGAWVYKTMPLNSTEPIFKGTIKAFILNLLLPLYILQSVVFMIAFKGKLFLDLIIVFLNILLYIVICFKMMKKILPFSEPFEMSNQSGGLIIIPLFFMLAALAFAHFGITVYKYGSYILIFVLIALNLVLWKRSFDISLEELG